jgi:hypothetical protein
MQLHPPADRAFWTAKNPLLDDLHPSSNSDLERALLAEPCFDGFLSGRSALCSSLGPTDALGTNANWISVLQDGRELPIEPRVLDAVGLRRRSVPLAPRDSATLASETIPDNATVARGQSFTKTWTVRNTGGTTWGSNYSWQYVSGNAGCNHSSVRVNGTVGPNATYVFSISCVAPTTAGTYREDWRLVGPSGTINVGNSVTSWVLVRVNGTDAAAFVSETILDNTLMARGQTFVKSWTLRNTGTTSWGAGYSLAYVSGSAGCSHNAIPVTGSIASGGTYTFSTPCVAPTGTGTFREDWRFVGPSGQINVGSSSTVWIQIRR